MFCAEFQNLMTAAGDAWFTFEKLGLDGATKDDLQRAYERATEAKARVKKHRETCIECQRSDG